MFFSKNLVTFLKDTMGLRMKNFNIRGFTEKSSRGESQKTNM